MGRLELHILQTDSIPSNHELVVLLMVQANSSSLYRWLVIFEQALLLVFHAQDWVGLGINPETKTPVRVTYPGHDMPTHAQVNLPLQVLTAFDDGQEAPDDACESRPGIYARARRSDMDIIKPQATSSMSSGAASMRSSMVGLEANFLDTFTLMISMGQTISCGSELLEAPEVRIFTSIYAVN